VDPPIGNLGRYSLSRSNELIKDFMSLFEDFSFTLLESNKVLHKEDMKQEYIKYVMNPQKGLV
jgi:hypothetical protein